MYIFIKVEQILVMVNILFCRQHPYLLKPKFYRADGWPTLIPWIHLLTQWSICIPRYLQINEFVRMGVHRWGLSSCLGMQLQVYMLSMGVFLSNFLFSIFQKLKEILGILKSEIGLDCTNNPKRFSITDIQRVFGTLDSLTRLTQYIPLDVLVSIHFIPEKYHFKCRSRKITFSWML